MAAEARISVLDAIRVCQAENGMVGCLFEGAAAVFVVGAGGCLFFGRSELSLLFEFLVGKDFRFI